MGVGKVHDKDIGIECMIGMMMLGSGHEVGLRAVLRFGKRLAYTRLNVVVNNIFASPSHNTLS